MDRSKNAGKSCQILTPPSSHITNFQKTIRKEKAARFSPLLLHCLQPAPLQPLDSPPLPENNGIKISSDECSFPAELLSNLLWLSSSTGSSSSPGGEQALDIHGGPKHNDFVSVAKKTWRQRFEFEKAPLRMLVPIKPLLSSQTRVAGGDYEICS